MRQRVVPLLAPSARTVRAEEIEPYQTKTRGMALLNTPSLNKGTAFTAEEREALGLNGLLPTVIGTLEEQVTCAYAQYLRLPDALGKKVYLTALHDRNEVLFYRVLSEHLREMIPVVNDRTAGAAMEQHHDECRRPRGIYLSIDRPEAIEEAFRNLGAGPDDIDLILATDGKIESAIAKLAIHTAAGGIDPARVIPVTVDAGGKPCEAFADAYVSAARKVFPHALLQWENFGASNGRRILEKFRRQIPTFNDDLQGTGAITLAAAVSAMRICGTLLRNQRVVIFGAGVAGTGVADLMREVMVDSGLPVEDAAHRFWCVDSQGLLAKDMGDRLLDHQTTYARTEGGGISLMETIRRVRPTMLVGTSGVTGAFTESIVREMARHVERPIIFALSTLAEATPADLITWTEGRALIATGRAFSPVTHKGITHVIGQANNAMLYPGLGLGAIVSRARLISVGMLAAAANALSSLVAARLPGASLLPHVDDLRSVTVTVAVAVAEAALLEGVAGVELDDIVQQVEDAMWQPEYRRIQAS